MVQVTKSLQDPLEVGNSLPGISDIFVYLSRGAEFLVTPVRALRTGGRRRRVDNNISAWHLRRPTDRASCAGSGPCRRPTVFTSPPPARPPGDRDGRRSRALGGGRALVVSRRAGRCRCVPLRAAAGGCVKHTVPCRTARRHARTDAFSQHPDTSP